MSDSDQGAPSVPYDAASSPTHTANDFDRIGWTRLDCIAADAKSAGKAVMYNPDGSGFVAVQCEDGEP